jgi:hypothetical protein
MENHQLEIFSSRLPRLIRVEASNTAGRVHQLQAFFLFLRGRHYTFVYLAAYKSHFKKNRNLYVTYTTSKSRLLIEKKTLIRFFINLI